MAHVEVTGVVHRINQNGIGFTVKESWTRRDGSGEGARYWSCWMPTPAPVEVIVGEPVKVAGLLGAKVSTRDARYVDYTVNEATVTRTGSAPTPAPEPEYTDAWETANVPDGGPWYPASS